MTTYHDPQPQSRRAVRNSERAETTEASTSFTETEAPEGQFPSQVPTDDMWDTVARRAAQLSAVPRPEASPSSGRRAAAPPQAPLGEPLTYATQGAKPAVPSYDGPSFRNRGSAATPDDAAQPPTQAMPQADRPSFRSRDFSPEGRRAAQSTQPSWSTSAQQSPPPNDLDYHTEARPERLAIVTPIVPISHVPPFSAPAVAPVTPSEPPAGELPTTGFLRRADELPIEHTLTRRELRAMQQAEEASLLRSQAPELVEPTRHPSLPVTPIEAPSSFDDILNTASPAQAPPARSFDDIFGGDSEPEQISSTQRTIDALLSTNAPEPRVPTFSTTAPEPDPNTMLTNAIAEFDDITGSQRPPAEAPAVVSETPFTQVLQQQAPSQTPSTWTPPVGHWSIQSDDDDELPENTISRRRSVGSGSTATSALVLPSIPMGADIRGPLTGTGEIMLTGSIELPRSLASTGQSDRFDNGGIDALFDLGDSEVISTDSSPVRAIRAVSTHTSGHGVTHTQKPKGTRALTALLIAASAMAVVVAGLLVAAFAFNVF